MHPLKKTARIAGAIYLSLVITGPFSLIYVPGKLIVRGDAAATANNFLAHQTMFGFAIMTELFGSVIFICLGIALHRLLSGVNKTAAGLMVAFVLVSATIGFFNTLNNIAAMSLFRGNDFLSVVDTAQRQAFGMLFVRLHGQGNLINEIFWGLWLFPLGVLVFESGFLPRFIGVWLMIDCCAWLVLSPIALFDPPLYQIAFKWAQPALFGELVMMLYLLIKGAKVSSESSIAPGVAPSHAT